jgi:hypothetical protein
MKIGLSFSRPEDLEELAVRKEEKMNTIIASVYSI